jgi:hypothetical protein
MLCPLSDTLFVPHERLACLTRGRGHRDMGAQALHRWTWTTGLRQCSISASTWRPCVTKLTPTPLDGGRDCAYGPVGTWRINISHKSKRDSIDVPRTELL